MKIVITVFAYKRPDHLKRVLSAIVRQIDGRDIPIVVFIDGPRFNGDQIAVNKSRDVAKSFTANNCVSVKSSESNKGLYESLTQGISSVFQDFDAVIVIEDDILVSQYFLDYMVAGLRKYQHRHKVASIHGYSPPITRYQMPENFFLRGADCWGWATWKDRWSLFNSDASAMATSIEKLGLTNRFNLYGNYDYMSLLKSRANGKSSSWAICWHATCFLSGLYTMHPGRSLVKNIGLESSGEHCASAPWMDSLISEAPVQVIECPIEEDPHILKIYSRQIAGRRFTIKNILARLKNFVKLRRSKLLG